MHLFQILEVKKSQMFVYFNIMFCTYLLNIRNQPEISFLYLGSQCVKQIPNGPNEANLSRARWGRSAFLSTLF